MDNECKYLKIEDVTNWHVDKCGTCKHYIGAGDWNLCCGIHHPTPKEQEMGKTFIFGHLCYENTDACDMYEPKGESHVDENCTSR